MRHVAPDSTRLWAIAILVVLFVIAIELTLALAAVGAGW